MTRRPNDFEIEAMPERSWDRIERRVFARLDTADVVGAPLSESRVRARWPLVLSATALAGAVAAAMFVWLGGETSTHLRSSRVVTSEAPSSITVDSAELIVAPNTALVWSGDDERGVLIVLERGEVDCAVAPRRNRPPFAVQAGDVRVEVVGTRFSVTREGDSAIVEVSKGTVRVQWGDETTLVDAGKTWPTEIAARVPVPVPDPVPEPATVMNFENDVLPPADRTSSRKRGRQPTRPRPDPTPSEERVEKPTDADRYRRAAELEIGDPQAAIAIYRDLARRSGSWAATALFAHARLELDRGRRNAAAMLLRSYLRRFPTGPNAEDARALLRRLP